MLTVGSLFAGIGGFDLGLERAGMRTVWFCEQDEFCRRVLARHWPGVPCHPDVRALVGNPDRAPANAHAAPSGPRAAVGEPNRGLDVPVPVPYVDVLCGGFPCQDLSLAGKGAGIDGARSGLWAEFARLIGELSPRYVIVENVSALLARGMGRVLGDLAALGYDAEWDCIPASAVGAPHRRDRVWVVAYPNGKGESGHAVDAQPGRGIVVSGGEVEQWPRRRQSADGGGAGDVRDADGAGLERRWGYDECPDERAVGPAGWWLAEPSVGRVAHGIPARVDRLRSLGNSLVPQIAEWLGRRIIEWEEH